MNISYSSSFLLVFVMHLPLLSNTKMRRSSLSRNHYFVIGLFLGLVLSFYVPQDIWELVQQEECPQEAAENSLIEKFGQEFEPHLNLINKPLAAKKTVSTSN